MQKVTLEFKTVKELNAFKSLMQSPLFPIEEYGNILSARFTQSAIDFAVRTFNAKMVYPSITKAV